MKVRFVQDYQGQYTGPHFYRVGQVVELDEATAARLISDGRAVSEVADWDAGIVGVNSVDAMEAKSVPAVDYTSMLVAELKTAAAAAGIEGYSTMRKAELITALNETA